MPSVTVTIAEIDVSTDFVSLSTEQDICSLAQTCEIELNPGLVYDTEQGNLSYSATYFTDTGQHFGAWNGYLIVITNADGSTSSAYLGELVVIDFTTYPTMVYVYEDPDLITPGWREGGTGTPSSYQVRETTDYFLPWDELVIAINGTNRLTGYVSEFDKSRKANTISGVDEMKRATDTFVTDEVRVEEELDAGYWIDYWLTEVGITTSGSVETGRDIPITLPDEEGWIYISVGNIILECLAYAGGGYVVIIDGDGVAQIREKTIGASSHTLDCIEFSRSQDDSWYRDRAVVFGTTSGSWDEGVWIPGEVTIVASSGSGDRTAVLSSSYIQTRGGAEDLANDILNFFDEYLDVKRCLIEGDESIWLGDSASVDEFGYNGTGLVTSIETTVDDNGFRQLVSLDEKCGFIWGFGKPYGQMMFSIPSTLTTGDSGRWFLCDIPDGITMLNTYAAVKTEPDGASIQTQIQTSTDGTTWTTQHTNVIADGSLLSGKQTGFTQAFVAQGTLVRANTTQIGSTEAGADLTMSVGIKIGEV